jgi:hypothetical protein
MPDPRGYNALLEDRHWPLEGAFRVKKKDSRILRKRKRKIARRLARRAWREQSRPMLRARNIQYDMADRIRAIDCGGIGAFHLLAQQVGLVAGINQNVPLLKRHLPYFESDHVLNIAYNTLTGGTCLDDLEGRRQDAAYLDALGAQRIPDPTTAGDFTRRFGIEDVTALMETANGIRPQVWRRRLSRSERREAILDVDGTIAPTTGACKAGMGLSYHGVWGYHPLVISLANTSEPLYLVNRPGNRPSHEGAAEWIDRAVDVVRSTFDRVVVRGDTDFALTAQFDGWTASGVGFAFGLDAMPNLVTLAEGLESGVWRALARRQTGDVPESRRQRPANVKEQIVREKGYRNIRLKSEWVTEVAYQPTKCRQAYRLVILRKDLSVERGEAVLFPEIRYFFYITNVVEMTAPEVVFFCRDRCNQENLIEQLKNGLNALRMPVGDLVSNWAYMVMASLAWTLKAWFALMVRHRSRRSALLRMEFRRFLMGLVRVPAQIVQTGRRIVYRILGYTEWTRTFLEVFDDLRGLRWT